MADKKIRAKFNRRIVLSLISLMRFFLFILFLISDFSLAESQIFEPVDSIRISTDGQISDFSVDDFNNIYYIRNFTELNKIDFKTGILKSFSNRNILEDLNTQNVLQLTLKSGFFNLLILDNQLNPIQDPIDFSNNLDFTPTLIALVDNNYLWAYDPILQKLILWNYRENKTIRQSVILNNESSSAYFSKLIYESNKIYLIGTDQILKFDEFANLEKVISFEKHKQVQLLGQFLFYTKDEQLWQLDLKTDISEKISQIKDFDFFSINNNFLFVLKNQVIYLYKSQKQN